MDDTSSGPTEWPENDAAIELLRRLIATRRISMGELDDQLGHARGYVSRLLQGKIRLTYEGILSVLKVLNIDPNLYFTTLHPPPRPGAFRAASPASLAAAASSRRAHVAELRALLLEQLREALPELEEVPRLADDDLEARILATVQTLLTADLPRPPRG
jgi:transcriptional regulator with XRE-family HTH domain